MTRQEFTNIEKGIVELLPIPLSGRRERAVIHPSPKRKGYIQWSLIVLNPKTEVWEPGSDIQFPDRQALRRHLEVIHRQEIKQAVDEGKHIPDKVMVDYPEVELPILIKTIIEKGELFYTGEILGLGKQGDVYLSYEVREAVKDLGFILEDHPELSGQVPKEIKELIKGKYYEGIFENLRKTYTQEHVS